jgi:hypothetical protein
MRLKRATLVAFWELIAWNGSGLGHFRQCSAELGSRSACSPSAQVFLGRERCKLLGGCRRNELVDRDALALRELSKLAMKRVRTA